MTNTPDPFGPIVQPVATDQSNDHQAIAPEPQIVSQQNVISQRQKEVVKCPHLEVQGGDE